MSSKHTPEGLAAVAKPTDDSIAILRFNRSRAGEPRLMVGVEFYPQGNTVMGNVYDADAVGTAGA